MQFHDLVGCFSPDTLLYLLPEDRFFTGLYGKFLPLSTPQKVCFNWRRIWQGLMTIEEPWRLIPRNALEAHYIWRLARRHEKCGLLGIKEEHGAKKH
jgi:hypothetical protein